VALGTLLPIWSDDRHLGNLPTRLGEDLKARRENAVVVGDKNVHLREVKLVRW
jgi:hypothetical protein